MDIFKFSVLAFILYAQVGSSPSEHRDIWTVESLQVEMIYYYINNLLNNLQFQNLLFKNKTIYINWKAVHLSLSGEAKGNRYIGAHCWSVEAIEIAAVSWINGQDYSRYSVFISLTQDIG